MQITKIITTVVATACLSTAVPTANGGEEQHQVPTVGKGGNAVCGNGQVISCCNSKDTNNGLNLLDGLLGGNCSPLALGLLGLAIPVTKACGNNQAACCTGDQNGLVNLQCNNIGVL